MVAARMMFRALSAVFALSALARGALAALLFARAREPIELYFAGAIALVAWAACDAFVAWALVRAELTGRMLGFVSAALSAVVGWGALELFADRRGIAVIALAMGVVFSTQDIKSWASSRLLRRRCAASAARSAEAV
jgi:hypothetical protein